MKEVIRNKKTGRYYICFRFGGGVEAVWSGENGWEDVESAATPEQVALYLAHRISGTSPGNPKGYALRHQTYDRLDNREFGKTELKFKPGMKPKLPAGVSRLEDLEGYLSDDPETSPA
jgi:hypothetical protein